MKTTRFCCMRYSYFVDIQTDTTKPQIIKFTAGGSMPYGRLRPFFSAYKYWKLGKIGVRFMPASTLPVDPTGLSYEAGESTVDPRDEFNMGLCRRTNGENVDFLTGYNADKNAWYYSTLLDPRWSKFDLQRGFRMYATPRFWGLAQTTQTIAQSFVDIPQVVDESTQPQPVSSSGNVSGIEFSSQSDGGLGFTSTNGPGSSNMKNIIIQNSRPRMTWQPTDMLNNNLYGPNVMPEVECITCVLPQAYKTVHYYRVWISETIYFRTPVVLNPLIAVRSDVGDVPASGWMYQPMNVPLDRYIGPNGNATGIGQTSVTQQYRGNPITAGYVSTAPNVVEKVNR